MEFPLEIWDNILSNIRDPESLSFCRKTCYTFRDILNRRTYKIETKNKKRYFFKNYNQNSENNKSNKTQNISQNNKSNSQNNKSNSQNNKSNSQNNKSLKLDFLLSFPKLKICDYPLIINKYEDFYHIYKLVNSLSRKMRITLKLEIDPGLFSIFLDSYNDILENVVFKILDDFGISWITKNLYAKYGSKELDITDFNLLHVCDCKHFISNSRLEKEFYFPSMESYTYLSSIDNLIPSDYEAPLFCKNYYWRPIKCEDRRKIDNLISLSSSLSISEVRPKLLTYEIPFLYKDLPKMKKVYFNCQTYRFLYDPEDILSMRNILSIDNSNDILSMRDILSIDDSDEKCFYYSSKAIKNGIDLSNPPYAEKYIDDFLDNLSK